MPLWAKVDVDMPTDAKLLGQPVVTRHLWTCLICLAKRQDEDGSVRGYDCALLAGSFNLPKKEVAKALTHFQQAAMIELDVDGTIRLLNFAKRQGPTGTGPERSKRYYETHRDTILEKKRASRTSSRESSPHADGGLTSDRVRISSLEVEGEEDREGEVEEKEIRDSSSSFSPQVARASQTDATPTEQAKLKHALGTDHKPRRDQRGPAEIRDLVGGVAAVANAAVAKREGT